MNIGRELWSQLASSLGGTVTAAPHQAPPDFEYLSTDTRTLHGRPRSAVTHRFHRPARTTPRRTCPRSSSCGTGRSWLYPGFRLVWGRPRRARTQGARHLVCIAEPWARCTTIPPRNSGRHHWVQRQNHRQGVGPFFDTRCTPAFPKSRKLEQSSWRPLVFVGTGRQCRHPSG